MTESKPYRIGYARVSTGDQNLDLQLEALRKAGVREDNIHVDKISTRSPKRPGLETMWKDLRRGDTLVVWKMDRLGRDVAELIRTVELLEKKGCELLSLTEHLDTTTALGRMHFNIMATFAQYERDLTRERTKAGLATARAQGRKGGRQVKFTSEVQEEAQRLLAEGRTALQVAKALGFSKSTVVKYTKGIPMPVQESDHGR